MPDKSLILNDKKISFKEIKECLVVGNTAFEKSTLAFCRQWLNGQASFSLKTSGSTGEPKLIRMSRYQMCLSAKQTIDFFNLSPVDRVLVCLNTAYIAGIMMLVRAMESEANIIAIEPTGNPLQDIDQQIDFVAVVPLQLQQILDNAETRHQLEKFRAVIVGGALVSVSLMKSIQESTANIYATFGMTETLTHFALKQLNPNQEGHFTAFNGVTIGQDSRRCLTVASPIMEDRVLVSNDLVEILSPNTFNWLGRIDNVINSGGVKLQIEALERKVEQAFYELGLTNRFLIGTKPDEVLGEKVVLIVESKTELEILSNLEWSGYLEKYEKPKEVLYSSRFQETPTGKINRIEIISSLLSY
jgi:O-succinylbenzoic acid--CoA ligase